MGLYLLLLEKKKKKSLVGIKKQAEVQFGVSDVSKNPTYLSA